MTPARVRACNRFASRARKRGAAASWRSNTLRLTTMMGLIVGGGDCANGWTGGPAVSNAVADPTASPPVPQTAVALLDQVNALVQRKGHVASGGVPFRKIKRPVHPAGGLPQAAPCHAERPPARIRPTGGAEANP